MHVFPSNARTFLTSSPLLTSHTLTSLALSLPLRLALAAKFFGGVSQKKVGKLFKQLDADGSGDCALKHIALAYHLRVSPSHPALHPALHPACPSPALHTVRHPPHLAHSLSPLPSPLSSLRLSSLRLSSLPLSSLPLSK